MQEEGGRPAERGRPPHLPLQFKIRGLFCRGVRRDEGIPPYGRPGGCGCPVWPVAFGSFVGEGHGPSGGLAAARGPRDDASIVPYRGLRYRRGCRSPVGRGPCRFVGADSISARGCLRRRVFPVGLYVFPRPVGRAFTPAAPWRFQKSGPCAAAGPGGMRASRPTAVRVVAALRLAADPPLVVGEGFIPPAGLAAARGPRDDASIVPYRGLRYRRGCRSPVGRGPCRFVGADSISARGCLRRRVFPVGLYVFPRPVGRAFTPAAPWRFQKSGPCAAAGPGGMRASRPTAVRVVAALRLAADPPLVVGEGFIPPAGLAAARGPRDDASIVPYRSLRLAPPGFQVLTDPFI